MIMKYNEIFKKLYWIINLIDNSFFNLGSFFSRFNCKHFSYFFLYYIFRTKNYYYFNNAPFKIFLIFWLSLIFCSLLSDNILFSLKSSFFYIRIGIFVCFIWYLIDKDKNFLNLFYYFLLICFSCLIIDGFYQYFNKTNLFGIERMGGRISSFFW